MDVNSFMLENEFDDYCRERFDRINIVCDFLGNHKRMKIMSTSRKETILDLKLIF